MSRERFQKLATIILVYTLGVIVWGAFVRASGSGAGCGSHWPLCNGEVVPRAPATATLIEITHRITSGLALPLVIVQVIYAYRATPRGDRVRTFAWLSLFLMVTEAAIGAGLVLFEKVAGDKSIARGYWMSAHLINTFLLVASMTLVVWQSGAPRANTQRPHRGRAALLTGSALVALLLTGVSGAIAALGDTLFPAKSLAEGLAADLAGQAHVFVELRVLHPFVAVATAILLLLVTSTFARSRDATTRKAAQRAALLVLLQVGAGIVNLLLAAPIAMQLVHLLLADFVWMSVVVLAAEAVGSPSPANQPAVTGPQAATPAA